jgi:hypothetical protein
MEAARLQKVADRLDLGTDPLRALAGTEGKIPKGNSDIGPAPTAAPYSGTKLPTEQTAANFQPGCFCAKNFGGDSNSSKAATQDSKELNSPLARADFGGVMQGDGSLYAKKVAPKTPEPNTDGGDFEPRG